MLPGIVKSCSIGWPLVCISCLTCLDKQLIAMTYLGSVMSPQKMGWKRGEKVRKKTLLLNPIWRSAERLDWKHPLTQSF